MDGNVAYQNISINSRNNNVICAQAQINFTNTDESKVGDWSRDLTSYSEPIQCYSHSDWLPSERNLVYIADENRWFVALSNSSDQISEDTWIHSSQFPAKTKRTSAVPFEQ